MTQLCGILSLYLGRQTEQHTWGIVYEQPIKFILMSYYVILHALAQMMLKIYIYFTCLSPTHI